MRYVIGITDFDFIQIKSYTMWDGNGKLWDEIHKVSYDCMIEDATIINSYDEAKEIVDEIQNRISEIEFSNISIIGQLLDEEREFNKVDYAKELKIFRLVPMLVEDANADFIDRLVNN